MNGADQTPSTGAQSDSTNDLEKASLDTVYAALGTSPKGLASSEVKQRLEKYGRNELVEKEVSDLDLELPDGTTDGPYLDAVRKGLDAALDRSRPDLVLYVSGADPHEHDRLGRLGVTLDGLRERDEMVLSAGRNAGAAVAVVMSGGYGTSVHDTVAVHLNTVRAAIRHARP